MKRISAILFILVSIFSSCRRDRFLEEPSAQLSFSTDTVLFDTVFTNFSSANKILMVYNPYDQPLKLTSVRLAGGSASFYQINFNGVQGSSFSDVEIYPKDSIYIFVAVKIDQVGQDKPLLVRDSLLFSLNGNVQKIMLVSYGQDVHIFKNSSLQTQEWTSNKPYLLFGNNTVENGHTLTMQAGTRVYMYNNASITIEGNIQIKGTTQQRVLIQQSRTENDYYNVEGQWGKLIIKDGSKNNLIENTDIWSPVVGIQIGEPELNSKPDLRIRNTMIINAKLSCIKAFGAEVRAENCVFANANEGCVILYKGGKYNFYHCTINHAGGSTSLGQGQLNTFYYNDSYSSSTGEYSAQPDSIVVINTIINGGLDITMQLNSSSSNYYFKNCIMKADWKKFNLSDHNHFDSIFYEVNRSTLLKMPSVDDTEKDRYDFTPDSLSDARGKASLPYALLFPQDLKGNSRIVELKPDIGALQWQAKK